MPTKEYRKPGIFVSEFTCPHCGSLAYHESLIYQVNVWGRIITEEESDFSKHSSVWYEIGQDNIKHFKKILINNEIKSIIFMIKICSNCGERCYFERIVYPEEEKQKDILIYPQKPSLDIEPNEDMDKEDKDLFNEAKKIFDDSPKAAGALLRSVLENIVKKVFKDKLSPEDNTLYLMLKNQEVQKILISKEIKNICKACRLIGNKASHPLLIDMNDQKKEVGLLFKLINLVAKKIISDPLEEKNLSNEAEKII